MADLVIPDNWFVAGTTVDGMYRNLEAQIATIFRHRVERPTPDTLVIRHQNAPGWWWVRTGQTATIRGIDVEGGARFTAAGRTSDGAVVVIRRAFGVPEDRDAPPSPAGADVEGSALDRVEELADLRDRGILTDDEFEAAKATLLGEHLADGPER